MILRALCPTESGEIEVLGEETGFWEELRASLGDLARSAGGDGAVAAVVGGAGVIEDRRCEGFAGVAGDLFSSGEPVLVAVADVPRRRAGLEAVVAALASGAMPVISWSTLAAKPRLADGFQHLVALDPPPGGVSDPLLDVVPRAHLAWGPAEAEFARSAYRAAFDLRPGLTAVYRALRELPGTAAAAEIEAALRGPGRYPRDVAACSRLLEVLTELSLVELDVVAPSVRVVEAVKSDLELSPAYRASRAALERAEQALAPEIAAPVPATAAG